MNTRLASYAQIGKAELIQAIGVINNYDEITGIDFNIVDGKSETFLNKKRHSEKDIYGDKKRLSTAPMLFWMYIHYLSPDEKGMVRDVSIVDAAKYLHLSVKSIRKAVDKLSQLGYIYSSRIICNTVTIMLPDFENYFKQKDEGGHGYLELSEENFMSIVSIAQERMARGTGKHGEKYVNKSLINKIRIKLRSFIMCDHAQRQFKRNRKATTVVEKSVSEMLRFLPGYMYKKKLLQIIDSITDTISYYVLDGNIIKMDAIVADFNGIKERNSILRTISKNVREKLENMNSAIEKYNADRNPACLTDQGIYLPSDIRECETYWYSADAVKDISKLCLQYTEEIVFEALEYVYSNFVVLGRTINNIGALLRSTIKSYCF